MKKKKNKNSGTDLMDMLKQQINLRYKNLRKHEEESNEEEEEDDNFWILYFKYKISYYNLHIYLNI